jgi:uncharacterized protein
MTTEPRIAVSATSPRIAILRAHRKPILRLARAHGARDVRVFGSVVRGEDVATSDIDLLVSFDVRGPEGLLPIERLRLGIEELIGESVDVVPEALLRPSVAAAARREAMAL